MAALKSSWPKSILSDDPAPPLRERMEVPAELLTIVARALRKEMNARFQSAAEMVGQLKDLREELRYRARLRRQERN